MIARLKFAHAHLARIGAMLLAAAAAGAAGPAVAQAVDWDPFTRNDLPAKLAAQSYDRSFTKEWEANPPRGYPTLSSANIEATKAAIRRYTGIVARGGWRTVPDVQLQSGSNGPAVGMVRERLMISGDIAEQASFPDHFDYYLEKAVKRFQASNGLTPTGVVDKRTVAALNIPAAVRLRQLQSNLGRIQELARGAGKKYVLVNIPAAQIEAVANDQVVSRHSGVVGKTERPTPILRSAIHEMNFNPMWTLPPTVIEKDLIPTGQQMQKKGQSVLVKYGIDAYDGSGKKLDPNKIDWSSSAARNLQYRQQPGKENPLGFLKINFHNSYSVYMHDTPSDSLFGRNFRAASSGCIRVQGIEQLATWLLAENEGWTKEKIALMKQTGERLDLKLKRPVPLYFAYITAWATEDGIVQFRRDLYLKDGAGTVVAGY